MNKSDNQQIKHLYSLIIPTYNERENIAILIYLINKHLNEKYFEFINKIF